MQDTPSGILNITAISSGAHVFMSKPHFLDCEDSIPDAFGPDMGRGVREKHDTFIDVDPVTGAVRHKPAPNFNFNFNFNSTSTSTSTTPHLHPAAASSSQVMDAHQRLQINYALAPVSYQSFVSKTPYTWYVRCSSCGVVRAV